MLAFSRWTLALLAVSACTAVADNSAKPDPMDWPFSRGPERNGVSHEVGLPDKWTPVGENLIWAKPEYASKSTPIVMNGKLYTLCRHKPGTEEEGEKVICVDAETGKLLWENIFNVYLSDVPDTRIGWSSVVGDPATGRVYALGVCGFFQCINGETGETVWSHSMSEEFGLLTTYGGRTNFPVVFDDVVIISGVMIGWGEYAKPNHRFIAFDKSTGESIWFNSTRPLPDDTTFSTPILGSFNGEIVLVVGAGDGAFYGIQPRTGKIVWKYQMSRRGVNGTPLISGDKIFVTQAEENTDDNTMGAVACLLGVSKGPIMANDVVWRDKEIMSGRSQPILIDDRLYVIDDGAGMFILDSKSGKIIKKQKLGTVMRASPLYVDGKLYICEANGRCWILKPDPSSPKAFEVLQKIQLTGESPGTPVEIQASPICSHGRIYITTTESMFCIGYKDAKPKLAEMPKPLEEASVSTDEKVAQIQIVPVESLIKPGDEIAYRTRTYNARGQMLGEAKAEYTVDANGTISSDGNYIAAKDAKHKASAVTAKVGDLTSTALVRIVPDLPWVFDFSDGVIPITWVGARYRHVPREVDGEKLMVKVTTIPKGTRSQSWMGQPTFHDYTIQADVKGDTRGGKMPDIGLIAQRYTLDLMGQSQLLTDASTDESSGEGTPKQQLQIRTWPPILTRMSKTIPFTWKPGVWYTIKFRAENKGDQAILKGKVWERDKPEPEEWSIEASDIAPNRIGSPGLYGNATNAEIFIDNIKVTPND